MSEKITIAEATHQSREDATLKIIWALGLKVSEGPGDFYKCDDLGENMLARYFLQSSDNEHIMFYDELCNAGFKYVFFNEPYHWKLSNGYAEVEYMDGDVYITRPKTREYAPIV